MSGGQHLLDLVKERAGSKPLSSLITLDLHNLGIEELDADILNQMSSLEVLDVSQNKLRKFPHDLDLPNLRKLDCSENRLSGLSFLAALPSLKELYTMGNGLQSADRYIAAALCPDLKQFDKHKPESLNKVVQDMHRALQPDIEEIWERKFEDDLESGILDLERDFERVCQQVETVMRNRHASWKTALRESLGDFLIGHLTRKFVEQEFSAVKKPPMKKARLSVKPVDSGTPSKDNTPRSTKKATPGKMNAGRGTPGRKPSSVTTPKKTTPQTTPKKSPANRGHTFTSIKAKPKKAEEPIGTTCPADRDYNPVHFMRCHFGDKEALSAGHSTSDPTDNKTSVWACQFEPQPDKPGETKHILATCGGEHVCLIDCSCGHVLQRLHQPGMQYSCLAWTTLNVKHEGRAWRQNILAVAGKGGRVELIQPTQHLWYASFGTDRPNQTMGAQEYIINCLAFHPSEPQWLFAGGSDGAVEMWDIGVPVGDQLKANCRKLAVLLSPAPQIMSLVFSEHTDHLVAATDRGLHAWKVDSQTGSTKHKPQSVEMRLPNDGEDSYVDSIVLLNKRTAACKIVGEGRIIVFNLPSTLSVRGKRKHYQVEPLFSLGWRDTDADFISMGACHGRLVVGDDHGTIWMYNVADLLDRQTYNCEKPLEPSRRLAWPECDTNNNREVEKLMTDVHNMPAEPELVLNSSAISSSGDWLVTTTTNNLVCVWKAVNGPTLSFHA